MKNPFVAAISVASVFSLALVFGENKVEVTPPAGKQKHIETGTTEAGRTAWKTYVNGINRGIYVDVDTSDKAFSKTPNYMVSLCGDDTHWRILGSSSVYRPTPKGFRIYLRWASDHELTPAFANKQNFRVTWIAVEE